MVVRKSTCAGEGLLRPQMAEPRSLQEFMELIFFPTWILQLGISCEFKISISFQLLWGLFDKAVSFFSNSVVLKVWSSDNQYHLGIVRNANSHQQMNG